MNHKKPTVWCYGYVGERPYKERNTCLQDSLLIDGLGPDSPEWEYLRNNAHAKVA